MGQDEQGAAIFAAEHKLQRAIGHINAARRLAGRVKDQHLPVGQIDLAIGALGHAFAAAISKKLQVRHRAIGIDQPAIGARLGFIAEEDAAAHRRPDQAIGI